MRRAARAFAAHAFAALRKEGVLPTPRYHPYVRVGRDYFGDDVRGREYAEFEAALEAAYPERFAEPLSKPDPEFVSTYAFHFLEACVARCGRDGPTYDGDARGVADSVNELIEVLDSPTYEAIACRVVAHLIPSGDESVRVGDVVLSPLDESRDAAPRLIAGHIPGAPSSFNREWPFVFNPPHALITTASGPERGDPSKACRRLSARLERFLLATRLISAGTVQSNYEVRGLRTLVSRKQPELVEFPGGMADSLVRRTARLSEGDAEPIAALGEMLAGADVKRDGMVATSFDVAVTKFNRSRFPDDQLDQIVELTTALEAILSGGEADNDALSLRLRTRAAALLSTPTDSPTAIFNDVNMLYGMRSKLVHGGQIKESELRKLTTKVSTIPQDELFGVAIAHAVDRLRDLVRRSILARLCLASGPGPLWPFSNTTPIDSLLVDPVTTELWKSTIVSRLTEIGAADAFGRPRAAVWHFAKEDR